MSNKYFSIKIAAWTLSVLLLVVSNDKSVARTNGDTHLTIRVLGTGDLLAEVWEVDTLKRHHSAYLLEYKTKKILIDCGLTIPDSLKKLLKTNEIDFVLLTHFHSDHIDGLPLLRYKDHKILIAGHENGIKALSEDGRRLFGRPLPEKLSNKFKGIRPNEKYKFRDIYSEELGITIETFRMVHPSPLKSFTLGKNPAFLDRSFPLGYRITFEHEGMVVAFTGDTEFCKNILKVVKDADLTFIECTSYEEFKKGHTRYVRDLAWHVKKDYKPKRWPLYVVHYDESMIKNKAVVNKNPKLQLAKWGDTFKYDAEAKKFYLP